MVQGSCSEGTRAEFQFHNDQEETRVVVG
ncbi:hypothetical protein LINPERHAP2_LOCUS13200 [Linum perenne]